MGKAVTAYFAFSDENRAVVREELQAAAAPEKKVSVAEVAKALGQKWRALDDAAKERYKAIAQECTKAAAQAAAAQAAAAKQQAAAAAAERVERDGSPGARADVAAGGSREDSAEAEGGADAKGEDGARIAMAAAKPAALPISIVKRIMSIDDEVDRTSAGAVRAIAWATELWLAKVAEHSLTVAAKAKRKTLKFSDIQTVAAKDKRMVEMGLQQVLDEEDTFAEARGEGHDSDSEPQPAKKQKKEDTPDARAQPITAFFGKAAGAAE